MNPYDKITEYLYLGSRHALDSYDKFKLIVNCTKESDVKFPPNCDYCIRLPVDDIPDESDKLLLLINTTNILNIIHKKVLKKGFTINLFYLNKNYTGATVPFC